MNANVDAATAAAPTLARVALHLGFSDPRSPLRVPLPVPPPLKVALVAQLGARGGTVVDGTQGLSSFHGSAELAIQAAVEILATGTTLIADEAAPLALRAVLCGVEGPGDAARAAALTRAYRVLPMSRDHTLLLTRDLYEQMDKAWADRARLAAPPAWADAHPELAGIFDLDWRSLANRLPEVTSIPEPMEAVPPSREHLLLTQGGVQLNLSAKDCPITLGRDKSCALLLDGDVASRVHARIEFVHDRFYLIDQSRNGTYMLTPQGEEVFLHNERLPLLGRGVISPGAPIVKQTGEVLRYVCRSDSNIGELIAGLVPPPGPVPPPHESAAQFQVTL